ncbi:MAG TPA: tRNA uridine-5-carboxymethylaminomethyl(34) synthesis GTPase MnmE [Bacteroidia bacterium]|jgi:tRNA modification GTPase|nr:tRNA uridine-5-carboxymethylaminomethyl(34) synthesis GTPase MnmE [Bacteroidia bacterium]
MKSIITDDTIVALSTPAGKGAIGVIRLSGPASFAICEKLFPALKLQEAPSHTLHFGIAMDGKEVVDEAVVGLFRAPKSYTCQDVIEISCHGSPFILQKVLQLLIKHGARPAKPGEFTMRAFLNGRFDLSQAEAVSDLIASESEAAHHIAINQMRGGFSDELKNLRQKLMDFASLIELELDFSEEDVEFANRKQLISLLKEMLIRIEALSESFRLGNVLKNGVSTVIAGRPNAGKSTLLNALLNEERAIVSDIPGTTRDTIEEVISIQGIVFRLTDTAGIREAADIIEKQGVERTMQKIQQASIVIYLFDAAEFSEKEVLEDVKKLSKNELVPIIPVANKVEGEVETKVKAEFKDIKNLIPISAKKGNGVETLKAKLCETALNGKQIQESVVLTNLRHYEALQETLKDLTKALKGVETKLSGELVSSDIRSALGHLGEITGEVTTDDLLGNIFSRFCIGK